MWVGTEVHWLSVESGCGIVGAWRTSAHNRVSLAELCGPKWGTTEPSLGQEPSASARMAMGASLLTPYIAHLSANDPVLLWSNPPQNYTLHDFLLTGSALVSLLLFVCLQWWALWSPEGCCGKWATCWRWWWRGWTCWPGWRTALTSGKGRKLITLWTGQCSNGHEATMNWGSPFLRLLCFHESTNPMHCRA